MYHGVDAVGLGGFRTCHGNVVGLDLRHDGVLAGLILVADCTIATNLDQIPAEFFTQLGMLCRCSRYFPLWPRDHRP